MASELTLAAWGAELQALLVAAQFTDARGQVMDRGTGERELQSLLRSRRDTPGHVYVVGNGGSAAVASHAANDLINGARLRALTLNDQALLTCMANDYGYAHVYSEPLSRLAFPRDLLVAISSSGRSPNITNAVTAMREAGGQAITLSGFGSDNPLRSLGDLNIYLPSHDYGLVEIGHLFILHHAANRLRAEQALPEVG